MKIVHLSDLHFGTENENLLTDLYLTIQSHAPDLIIISGDFTQIASHKEFRKAQHFIASFSMPVFCVPGNHDIPRYNLWERFAAPYRKYKRYINPHLSPVFKNDEVIIVGLNTARRILPHWNWANGAVSALQLALLEKTFKSAPNRLRICVLHHPLHKTEGIDLDVHVFGAQKALQKIQALNTHLVLSGHVHHASVTLLGKTTLASASTAISTRLRYQENGFNLITVNAHDFEIAHFTHDKSSFVETSLHRYLKN